MFTWLRYFHIISLINLSINKLSMAEITAHTLCKHVNRMGRKVEKQLHHFGNTFWSNRNKNNKVKVYNCILLEYEQFCNKFRCLPALLTFYILLVFIPLDSSKSIRIRCKDMFSMCKKLCNVPKPIMKHVIHTQYTSTPWNTHITSLLTVWLTKTFHCRTATTYQANNVPMVARIFWYRIPIPLIISILFSFLNSSRSRHDVDSKQQENSTLMDTQSNAKPESSTYIYEIENIL